ncbi:TetR/AcrR family transcriptional regulator [Streptomyces stelliscabiei]|uniref:AcrR family transcriptional regulator n=1 Tax=Streptomyces stelliscabiei TaxID=146820 RepID=A0A8I0P366_9ACTN|nr:TetR-like C-terminal domain-containing protein [Streptomyces stelliscabiei]KND41857.1 transcriptional regulator [Streptomyces stelliscabiei]MBE1594543.1 AcrR family transcriptional regulator [Streptomyces stelliscabiei]MDX2518802.1 TetR-like C-terminal domain-containing protein [Streptomyces stelliscabiei]MDX2556567.1 TetR-like C-terminal domain-containing protein [Streptomyces stelliscabiei]MDX2615247.1 TetR-like C-terminal domain-containing protein [Streptomyces stelliscabiei]
MAGRAKLDDAPERLVRAAIGLLAEQGPSAIKARTVASASGLSTMVVYSHFGGIPELMGAVADRGFQELGRAFAQVPVTDDPIADLFAMALSCRRLARENPHLYDLMFGLSTRATYRPLTEADHRLSGHSSAFRDAHAHITAACGRLARSGRVEQREPEVMAAQLWSMVHGYITLELGAHFVEFEDAVAQVFVPMGVNFAVGLGDERTRAEASHQTGARLYDSVVAGH